MARIRTIKHEFFLDEELASLPAMVRLTFIGLWTLADREGRLEDRPSRIRAQLFPYDPKADAEDYLNALCESGFIVRYDVDGRKYIQIRNFTKHQRPNQRESASEIPACTDSHVHARARTKMSVGNGSGEWRMENGDSSEKISEPSPDPEILGFETHGPVKRWSLTASLLKKLQDAYPALDVVAESRRARVWLDTNPAKRKTASGMPSFLNRWLSKAQNGGSGQQARASPTKTQTEFKTWKPLGQL